MRVLHGPRRRGGAGGVRDPAAAGGRPVGDDRRRARPGGGGPAGRRLQPTTEPASAASALPGILCRLAPLGPAPSPPNGWSRRCSPTCAAAPGWRTIVGRRACATDRPSRGRRCRRSRRGLRAAAARRATLEGGTAQRTGPRRGAWAGRFRRGHRPAGLSGRRARPRTGGWAVGETLAEARAAPGRCRAGAAGSRCATRSRCRPATGTSPSRPPGWSRPIWSPTRRGAFRAESRPTRPAMGGPSAGRSPRRPGRRPGPWPIGTSGRCRSSFPVKTWCGKARSARRSRPGCASTGPAPAHRGRARGGRSHPADRPGHRGHRDRGRDRPPGVGRHPGGRLGGGGGAGRRRPGPGRRAGAGRGRGRVGGGDRARGWPGRGDGDRRRGWPADRAWR